MARYVDIEPYEDCKIVLHSEDNGIPVRDIPTADVQEVIYCKNCKNYCKFKNGDVVCEEFGGYIKDNDFCSRGERKDGDRKNEQRKNISDNSDNS